MIPRRKGEEGQDGAMAEVLNDETGERREKTMSCFFLFGLVLII